MITKVPKTAILFFIVALAWVSRLHHSLLSHWDSLRSYDALPLPPTEYRVSYRDSLPSYDALPSTDDRKREWWEEYVDVVSVVYKNVSSDPTYSWCTDNGKSLPSDSFNENEEDPCLPHDIAEQEQIPRNGLWLVKTPKCASSTMASVTSQIAISVAEQKGYDQPCPLHTHHGKKYSNRTKPYFLWTSVRQPDKQIISSYFFFEVSRKKKSYNSTELIEHLEKKKRFQIGYIGRTYNRRLVPMKTKREYLPQLLKNKSRGATGETLNQIYTIFRTHDFIAVTERMDESLVVMKMLFGFKDEAILTVDGKRGGSLDVGVEPHWCNKIQKTFTTDDVKTHIGPGSMYREKNLDYLLHAAANRSLDRTIDALGRERVQKEVNRHVKLKKLATDYCQDKIIFPCTEEGQRPDIRSLENCFYYDVGCGHKCMMEYAKNYTRSLTPAVE